MTSQRLAALLLALAPLLTSSALAQDPAGGGTLQPGAREAMWPAPTAEDWARPCLITWQRTWDDALALSRESKRAILVCINMDGEIASEHYAGIRYRQPERAKLYEPYITVIASVYRHTPRDYDEQGHRILCPRFGSVTCGEHIAIEPVLYEQYMEGRRIAPRHIMVELDGKETYDVFYAFDTDSVFQAISDGITKREIKPEPIVRGDRSIVERVASPDIADRKAVEEAYAQGDRDLKRALLNAAGAQGEQVPLELLRQAVFGFDLDLAKQARGALSQTRSEGAIDLINEALRVPMDPAERDQMIAALERIGETSLRARTLAVAHQGLAARSEAVDVDGWAQALAGGASYAPASSQEQIAARLDDQQRVLQSADPTALIELAEASLSRALDPQSEAESSRLVQTARLEDARRTALDAEKLGATGWRVDAAVAVADYYLGRVDDAYVRAESAVKGMPADPTGWNAMVVLGLFAEQRHQGIKDAVLAKEKWPREWLTDAHAAYSLLLRHPFGDTSQALTHYDFLLWLGAWGQAARFLDQALDRFPDAWPLHARLRDRVLRRGGAEALEAEYVARLKQADTPIMRSFAGYASLVAAEFLRRDGRSADAIAAYDRGIAHYERTIAADPEHRAEADHYIAMALGGRARVSFEGQDFAKALEETKASFHRSPKSGATLDGLNISPVDTAKMLLAKLKELKQDDLASQLQSALGELDPALLRLPAYESEGPRAPTPTPRR